MLGRPGRPRQERPDAAATDMKPRLGQSGFTLVELPAVSRAFTLVELLVVVAIIAILAAIAVPNFLEAQVRSKVSRVKADMRSLATAIESYHVDHNKYPVKIDGDHYPEGYVRFRLTSITTPIAYMTSLPGDPFCEQNLGAGGRPFDDPSFIYLRDIYHPEWRSDWNTVVELRLALKTPDIKWVLVSQGPMHRDTTWVFWTPYDATNGTVSRGIIVRSGP